MEATDLQTELIKTALAIATPVLVSLVSAILYKALQRVGLDVDANRKAKVEYYVREAILRAEEWAAQHVKANMGQTTAAMKLDRALTDVVDKVPGITKQEAADLIHATLPKVSLGASVFLQGAREKATTGAR